MIRNQAAGKYIPETPSPPIGDECSISYSDPHILQACRAANGANAIPYRRTTGCSVPFGRQLGLRPPSITSAITRAISRANGGKMSCATSGATLTSCESKMKPETTIDMVASLHPGLRHAAALALLGWHTTPPPCRSALRMRDCDLDANAPVSKWIQSSAYDSASQCQNEKASLFEYYRAHPKEKGAEWLERVWGASQCVAADDPRLKGK